ncbi:MAG TPA: glycoside hydrolase family 97 protein [Cyclobacteriaceae bacterium]|nr:glycoside hydrolase family 97 protein [Cyclobacteriaceae bacterium]
MIGIQLFFSIILATVLPKTGEIDLCSPSGKICIKVNTGNQVTYSVFYDGKMMIAPSRISMQLPEKTLGKNSRFRRAEIKKVDELIIPVVPQRRNKISNQCNELIVTFHEDFSLTFRAYNDAIAWRMNTAMKSDVKIIDEQAEFNFVSGHDLLIPLVTCRDSVDCFHSSFEENYSYLNFPKLAENKMCFLPVLINASGSPKMLITESDLRDYPGMWLMPQPGKGNSLRGVFARYPLNEKQFGGDYKQMLVTDRADFIALTRGTRGFPWRIITFAEEDKDLLDNEIVFKLAAENVLKDVSWIEAGFCTDEWIVSTNFFNVDFKTGINTETYKYIIDFASKFRMKYIMMDAGWSDQNDLLKINPGIDLPELARYAKEKNVGLMLWCLAMTVDRQMEEAFSRFEELGIRGVLVDFMDRDDQLTVRYYEKVLQSAANHKLLVNFHGAFKETGLSRTYPNQITREAVLGHEYNMWSDRVTPEHDVLIAYIRNFSGPMDYEGGCMNNAQPDEFRVIFSNPMSQGTRVHQLAQYIVYVSPLQVLAGNFSQYLLEPDYAQIITGIPTSWDESLALDGQVGRFILIGRKYKDEWFVGALTNHEARDLSLSLTFLGEGKHSALIVQDGLNAGTFAEDYRIRRIEVKKDDSLNIHMAPGGGWMARITPAK